MAKFSGALDQSVTGEIFKALYGKTAEELRNEDEMFHYRFSIDLGFFPAGRTEEMYALTLSLPLAAITARREDWERLLLRIAGLVSEKVGYAVEPASWDQLCDFYADEKRMQQAHAFGAMQPEGLA